VAEQTEHRVTEELDGARVDKAVAMLLGVSRATARALVEAGVTVDGEPAGASTRVAAGSVLRAPRPEEAPEMVAEDVSFDVLFEDSDVIVVDKPAGVVVHPGSGRTTGSLAAGLLHRYPELEGVGQKGRWGIVHRLDRDTSGVLVVARTEAAHNALSEMLKRREISRTYTTLVHGLMSSPSGTIEAPVGRDPSNPLRRAVHPEGKPARTHYRVVDAFPERDCSLLEVTLETGRTHQIRLHMTAIGHPVVADSLYGGRRHRLGARRMFLHASRIGFTHPITGEVIAVESPLPPDLAQVLASLGPGSGPNPIRWSG
jgi:23S rRNA pseudouridine1911/1915/1917 synthase